MVFGFLRRAAPKRLRQAVTYCVAASLLALAAGTQPANAKTIAELISAFTGIGSLNGATQRPNNSPNTKTKRTRFVIGLDRAAPFQVFSLRNPNRVVVELPDVPMQLPPPNRGRAIGLVKSFRGGKSAPGKSRVVINVTGPVVVESAVLHKPKPGGSVHQLVLEIEPVAATVKKYSKKKRARFFQASASLGFSKLGAADVQPPLPRRALTPSKNLALRSKPLIVIDPGHGGRDSGAVRNGAVEKRVVLAFSKVLRDKLQATGRYRVRMTRDKDVFIPLDDRVRFAEKYKAALFIAVHADYANSSARGATIYSLRNSTADRLGRSASRQRAANLLSSRQRRVIASVDRADVGAVSDILADLVKRDRLATRGHTGAFTKSVIKQMGQSTNMKNNPDKSAGFRVLKTAKVPSVLIELAYVTNRRDAAQLKSAKWRKKVAASITTAVNNYFGGGNTKFAF